MLLFRKVFSASGILKNPCVSTTNSNLRTGARKVAADFALYRAKAIAEGREYRITIHVSPDNNYDIAASAKLEDPVLFPDVALNGVTPAEASQAQDAQITAVSGFVGGPIIKATQRGLVDPPPNGPNGYGTITLTNRRGSTAKVEIDSRGRVDVDVKTNML